MNPCKGGKKDPFRYSCSLVPEKESLTNFGNMNHKKTDGESSCFDVPTLIKNIGNMKQERPQAIRTPKKSSQDSQETVEVLE